MIPLHSLSGPFCILLAPVAALRCLSYRRKWLLTLLVLLMPGILIQCINLWQTVSASRGWLAPLGATPELLLKITAGQVFIGSLLGQRLYSLLLNYPGW